MDPLHPSYSRHAAVVGSAHEHRNTSLPPRHYTPSSLPTGISHQSFEPPGIREHEISSSRLPDHPAHHLLAYSSTGFPRDGIASRPPNPSEPHNQFASRQTGPSTSHYTPYSARSSIAKYGEESSNDPNHAGTYREGPSSMIPRDMSHPSQQYDQIRRRSLGSNGSSSAYSGHPDHANAPQPHTPGSYSNRQMPPPSSPQHYQPRGPSIQPPHPQHPLPPSQSSFANREALAAFSLHRPGSSMSISSMLDSNSDRPARDTNATSLYPRTSVTSNPPTTATQPLVAMSPPTAHSKQALSEFPHLRRSHTPDRGAFSKPPTPRPYRSGSGGAPSGYPQTSSDDIRFSALPRQPPAGPQYGEKPLTAPHSPRSSYIDSNFLQDRRVSLGGPIPRANKQLQQLHRTDEQPPRAPLFSPTSRQAGFEERGSKEINPQRDPHGYTGSEGPPRPSSTFSSGQLERHTQEQVGREQGYAAAGPQEQNYHQHQHQHQHQPQHQHQHQHHQQQQARFGPHPQEREGDRQRPSWDSIFPRLSPESVRYPAADTGSNLGFGAIQNYTKSLGSQLADQRSAHGPQLESSQESASPNGPSPLISRHRLQNTARISSPVPTSSSVQQSSLGGSFGDERARGGVEEPLHHRNVLHINAESKRGGRQSPLPQAVQGAQAQIVGPTGEPGIKNELGRVFSGIGSGVGASATASGSGPPTPMASSPFRKDGTTRTVDTEMKETENTAVIPKPTQPGAARRGRKVKGEGMKSELETAAIHRETGSTRGRKPRHVHHHHHHGHHHHHHRHKTDEDPSVLSQQQNATAGAPHRQLSQAAEGPIAAPGSHHHHHHHHHRRAPRSVSSSIHNHHQLTPSAPPQEYSTTVNLEPLLKSIRHLARYHLGSTLYAPRIGIPSTRAPPECAKFGYTTTPVPIPRFDGKENCTFTIRVPRFRIDTSHREEICARRAVWGTGAYTDDSDPVAAAIHSGFIRGEWGEDVDVSMLDLEIREQHQHAPQLPNGTIKTEPPPNNSTPDSAATRNKSSSTNTQSATPDDHQPDQAESTTKSKQLPPIPPPDKDLHITLLILPTLEQYDSSVMYGLKSRPWGGNHDGMSFKVESIEFVDERSSKGEERGGEARRKRLRNMMRTGRICTPAGLKGRRGVDLQVRRDTSTSESASASAAVNGNGSEGTAAADATTALVPAVESAS